MDPRSRIGTSYAERYQLIDLIGEGGMGAVYEARHTFTDRVMALKIIHPSFVHSDVARQRVLREARAPTSIDHPSILQILDAGQAADGSLYLAMERLYGRDLSHAVGDGAVSAGELLLVVARVLDALSAAHAAGLVHRDIKPANIFLAAKGDRTETMLLDFGITRDMGANSRLTATGTVMGTPHFMSPEQAKGGLVDGRSDLWSVGAVVYDALSGSPPFPGDNYSAVISQLVTSRPRPLSSLRPDLPNELCEIIDRSLDPDPAARFQTAEAFQRALEQSVDSLGDLRLPAASPTAPTALSHAPPPRRNLSFGATTDQGQMNTFGSEGGLRTSPDRPVYVRGIPQPTPLVGELSPPQAMQAASKAGGGPVPSAIGSSHSGLPLGPPESLANDPSFSHGSSVAGSVANSGAAGSSPAASRLSSPTTPKAQSGPRPRAARVALFLGLLLIPLGATAAILAVLALQPRGEGPITTTEPSGGTRLEPGAETPTLDGGVMRPIAPHETGMETALTPTGDNDSVGEEVQRLVDERLAVAEEERRERAQRAQARRAQKQAEEDAARASRCQIDCTRERAECARSGSRPSHECHIDWTRCARGCREP